MYRLYIVEDDSGIAEAVAERARSWGMDVRAAENFSDIMSEFARYSPHIVLMDVNLPFYRICLRRRRELIRRKRYECCFRYRSRFFSV